MPISHVEPEVSCVSTAPADTECDLLVVPVFEDDELTELAGLDAAVGGELSRARASGEFRPKANELFITRLGHAEWRASRVALVGVGPAGLGLLDRFRTAAATVVREAGRQRMASVAFIGRGHESSRAAQAIAEGLLLGSFDDRRFKTEEDGIPQG